jgi:hypothetical protein
MPGALPTSRFARLGRWPARCVLLILILATFAGMRVQNAAEPAPSTEASDHADVRLYERVIAGLRAGGDYHEVAAAAHRVGHYPLKPFVTVRLPTLAWVQAKLPEGAAAILLYLLAAATALAWAGALKREGELNAPAAIGAVLVASGAATLLRPELVVWHEGWAALLMALSLALHRDGRFAGALLAAGAAAAIREQAVLLPLVVGGFSLLERRWREAGAWGMLVVTFALFLAWHAAEVAAVTLPGDAASPGWSGGGGWQAAVAMAQATGPLRLLPAPAAALLVPVALLGWAAWPPGRRAAALLAANLLLLALFARPDNFYWGFLIAPLLPLGLLFAPRALADLFRAALPPRAAPLST